MNDVNSYEVKENETQRLLILYTCYLRILFISIFMQILFLLLHNEQIVVVAIIFESSYMTHLYFMLLS